MRVLVLFFADGGRHIASTAGTQLKKNTRSCRRNLGVHNTPADFEAGCDRVLEAARAALTGLPLP